MHPFINSSIPSPTDPTFMNAFTNSFIYSKAHTISHSLLFSIQCLVLITKTMGRGSNLACTTRNFSLFTGLRWFLDAKSTIQILFYQSGALMLHVRLLKCCFHRVGKVGSACKGVQTCRQDDSGPDKQQQSWCWPHTLGDPHVGKFVGPSHAPPGSPGRQTTLWRYCISLWLL